MDISKIGSYNDFLDTKYKSSKVPPSYPIPLHPNTLGILKSSSYTRGGGWFTRREKLSIYTLNIYHLKIPESNSNFRFRFKIFVSNWVYNSWFDLNITLVNKPFIRL
jgi:hypothetical protein